MTKKCAFARELKVTSLISRVRPQPREEPSRSPFSLMIGGLHAYSLEVIRLSSVALLSSRDTFLTISIQKTEVTVWADPRQLFSFFTATVDETRFQVIDMFTLVALSPGQQKLRMQHLFAFGKTAYFDHQQNRIWNEGCIQCSAEAPMFTFCYFPEVLLWNGGQ